MSEVSGFSDEDSKNGKQIIMKFMYLKFIFNSFYFTYAI